jgi:hypothetical protein
LVAVRNWMYCLRATRSIKGYQHLEFPEHHFVRKNPETNDISVKDLQRRILALEEFKKEVMERMEAMGSVSRPLESTRNAEESSKHAEEARNKKSSIYGMKSKEDLARVCGWAYGLKYTNQVVKSLKSKALTDELVTFGMRHLTKGQSAIAFLDIVEDKDLISSILAGDYLDHDISKEHNPVENMLRSENVKTILFPFRVVGKQGEWGLVVASLIRQKIYYFDSVSQQLPSDWEQKAKNVVTKV